VDINLETFEQIDEGGEFQFAFQIELCKSFELATGTFFKEEKRVCE
jgi:hypothetical protein